jgi:hypothetical protein
MNLYEIKQSIQEAIDKCIDMETGEIINPELLDNLNEQLNIKRENIALYIKNLVADSKAIDEEIKNLTARKKSINNKVDWLKQYLANDLQGNKFETAKVVVSFRKSKSVEINPDAEIPNEFLIQQQPKPDKAGLKKAIQSGEVINGVSIVEKSNISIK